MINFQYKDSFYVKKYIYPQKIKKKWLTDWLTAQINSSKNTKLIHKQNPKKKKMEFQKNVKWSEVKWSELNWSELNWSELKWIEVKWSELKWIDTSSMRLQSWSTLCRFFQSSRSWKRKNIHNTYWKQTRPNAFSSQQHLYFKCRI